MPRPPPAYPSARLARGAISWVTLVLVVVLVGGGYLAWTWFPVFIVNTEVKQVVHDYMNQAIKNPNDQVLLANMVHKLRTLDEQDVPDESGELVSVPTVQVEPQDVTWERDTQSDPATIHISFEYTRAVKYPLIGRWTDATLTIDLTGDLTRPDWGPAR